MGQLALNAVEPRLADARGQTGHNRFQNTADAVALAARSADSRLHGFLLRRIQQRKVSGLRVGHDQPRSTGKRCVLHACTLGNMGVDLYAQAVQHRLADRARRNACRRNAAREVPAAARVLKALVLGVGRVVGVAGAQQVGGFGVVAAAGIQVADHQGDGRAGGAALIHAGEELHGVGLGAGGGKTIPAGAAAVHGRGNRGLIHRQARGQPVEHCPHGRSMALTKNRHTDGISKGVFHISFPIFL